MEGKKVQAAKKSKKKKKSDLRIKQKIPLQR